MDLQELFAKANRKAVASDYPGAAHDLEELLLRDPDHHGALHQLGLVRWKTGRYQEAIDLLKKATGLDSSNAQYHYNLGTMLQEFGEYAGAYSSFRKALDVQPDYSQALSNCSAVLMYSGKVTECESMARKALSLKRDSPATWLSLANALCEQGRITEAIEAVKQAMHLKPGYTLAYSNYLLTIHYDPASTPSFLYEEHKKWCSQFVTGNSVRKRIGNPLKRPMRVGYVSSDFRRHSVAYFFEPLLEHHDRAVVEPVCYYNGKLCDNVTARLKEKSSAWRIIHLVPDDKCKQMIEEDRIDILVDLSGHTANNRLPLFALAPAPVQVSWLGYPDTTGCVAMDYRLTDEIADPPGQDVFHTEKLVRLPNGFLCYRPSDDAPAVNDPPFLTNGFITFGSFNVCPKINEKVIKLWSSVLSVVPGSRMVLKNRQFNDPGVRERFVELFRKYGISDDRLRICPPMADHVSHMSAYHAVDIALDTFPYNGTTTTCEALWMGVPVVTISGFHHAGRVGASLLSRIGLKSLVASDEASFVSLASFLAGDRGRLTKLRMCLREALKRSVVCDGRRFASEVEESYRLMMM